MTIGERIKERRLALNLSQDELAQKVGYKSRSSINKIELSRSLPLPKVSLMAKALETTEAALMGWEDSISKTSPDKLADITLNPELVDYAWKILQMDDTQRNIIYGMIDQMSK